MEVEAADDRRRSVARPLEDCGETRDTVGEMAAEVVPQRVPNRVDAGQDRGARGSSRGGGGIGPTEANAARAESVDRGSGPGAAGVAAEPVGPEAIDGDQEDVGARGRVGLRRGSAGRGPDGGGARDQDRQDLLSHFSRTSSGFFGGSRRLVSAPR